MQQCQTLKEHFNINIKGKKKNYSKCMHVCTNEHTKNVVKCCLGKLVYCASTLKTLHLNKKI